MLGTTDLTVPNGAGTSPVGKCDTTSVLKKSTVTLVSQFPKSGFLFSLWKCDCGGTKVVMFIVAMKLSWVLSVVIHLIFYCHALPNSVVLAFVILMAFSSSVLLLLLYFSEGVITALEKGLVFTKFLTFAWNWLHLLNCHTKDSSSVFLILVFTGLGCLVEVVVPIKTKKIQTVLFVLPCGSC